MSFCEACGQKKPEPKVPALITKEYAVEGTFITQGTDDADCDRIVEAAMDEVFYTYTFREVK